MLDRHRLPDPGVADDDHGLSLADFEGESLEHLLGSERLVDVEELDHPMNLTREAGRGKREASGAKRAVARRSTTRRAAPSRRRRRALRLVECADERLRGDRAIALVEPLQALRPKRARRRGERHGHPSRLPEPVAGGGRVRQHQCLVARPRKLDRERDRGALGHDPRERLAAHLHRAVAPGMILDRLRIAECRRGEEVAELHRARGGRWLNGHS